MAEQQIEQDVDNFFAAIDTAADSSQALGQDIPLLGAKLANITSAPLDLFQTAQDKIDAALKTLATGATAADIAAALNGAGVTGLTATVKAGPEPDDDPQVAIALQASAPIVPLNKTGVTLDTGVPALGLTATADFAGGLNSTLATTLDYDTTTGKLALDDTATNELDLGLGVSVNATADATLGPLGVALTTNAATPATPQVNLKLAVSLADDGTGTGTGITAKSVDATGGVNLDLALKTDPILGTDAQGESLLPTFGADLKIGYTLGGAPTVALDDVSVDLGGLVNQLAETLKPITKLFNETPFKQILAGVLGPIPIINDAADLLPFVQTLLDTVPAGGDKLINALDLAGLYFETEGQTDNLALLRDFASALAIVKQLTDFLNKGSAGAGGLGMIDLGDITLTGDTTADPTAKAAAVAPTGKTIADAVDAATVAAIFTQASDPAAAANTALAQSGLFSTPVAYSGATSDQPTALGSGLVDDPDVPDSTAGVDGLSIPLLTDPTGAEIEQILLPSLFPSTAPPPVLISYTIPELSFSVTVPPGEPLFLPIVGPFGLTLSGSFGAYFGFTVGYNTAGLATGNLADGLFLAAPTSQPADEPGLAGITSGVYAGIGVDLGVAQASINGGIKAAVGAGLDEPEVSFSDFTNHIDPTGKLDAVVNVSLTIGFGPFSFTLSDNIVDITIIDFSAGEAAGSIDQAAALASYEPGPGMSGVIQLNAGTRAGDRSVDPNDDNEDFRISNSAVDVNGDPTTDTLDVSALGVDDLFGAPGQPIQSIADSDLGAGDNTLTVDPDVTQAVSVTAGDGNNTFTAGGGATFFSAGTGNNNFYGGGGSDIFAAGAGADVFHPGSGPDAIEGSAGGHNQVTYQKSLVAVHMTAIDGGAELVARGNAQDDYLSNVQYIIGSAFDDTLVAGPGGATLDGGPGDDTLIGGAGDDFLIGGPGADHIDGGGGENGTSYITSRAGVDVILATGFAYGGDATGDVLLNIQDVQGTIFDDVLTGTPGVNRIDGNRGDDVINGDGGADYLEGGDGNDIIIASGDGDKLDGGSGDNTLSYEPYAPTGPSGTVGVTVDLATGQGGGSDQLGTIATNGSGGFTLQAGSYSSFQTLIGSAGDDTLTGDSNTDLIEGGAGIDVLVVGGGDSTLRGGFGADVNGVYIGDTLIGGTASVSVTDPYTNNTATYVGGGGAATADYSDGDGVTVNLTTNVNLRSTAAGDKLYGIANLTGTQGADILTGDKNNNVINPGLSGALTDPANGGIDTVDGGGGSDTLLLDYSQGDNGQGMTGGYGYVSSDEPNAKPNPDDAGSFRRMNTTGALLDGVDFKNITKLDVIGTQEADTIYGGVGDTISTMGGNDTIDEKGGTAVIDAGDGDDTVAYGTDVFHDLLQQSDGFAFSGPFYLDGGAGIDTLSISFADDTSAQEDNIALVGSTPGQEFDGTNLTLAAVQPNGSTLPDGDALPDGSAITNFEIIKDVVTANGDDDVVQPGDVDNTISTGFGEDTIAPGLGVDKIDGGYDFTVGKEISGPQTDSSSHQTYYTISDETAFLKNSGDLLKLDYSSYTGPGGVIGTMTVIQSTMNVRLDDGFDVSFDTNNGHYTAGSNTDDFTDIERLDVVGSSQNDVLVGTDDGFTFLPTSLEYNSLNSQRGDDILDGGAGDDILIGLTGSDTLDGGAGNDLLIGGENDRGRDGVGGEREIDTLTGGSGADTFVLGTNDGSFYDTFNGSDNFTLATTTRAIITDFTPTDGDTIELYDKASDYVAVQSGAETLLYDTNGSTDPQNYGLVAQIENFSGFDLNAAYLTYDAQTGENISATVDGTDLSPTTRDQRNADEHSAIQPLPSEQAATTSVHPSAVSLAVATDHITPAVTPQTSTPAFTVTRDNNPQDLEAALVPDAAAVGIDPSSQTIQLSGNAAAFGTFSNDPFGLGSGIVLSTGKVTDIVGTNTGGGSAAPPVAKTLNFVNIGTITTGTVTVGGFKVPLNDVVYRADLTGFGTSLGSLTLTDGNTGATDKGGGGVASGFDLDGVALSHTLLDGLSGQTGDETLNALDVVPNAFDFSAAGLRFTPGTQKPGDASYSQGPNLLGSINGLVDNSNATLQTFDGGITTGALSLGDGGSLGLNLTQPVSTTAPLYLYIAEAAAEGTGAGETIDGAVNASNAPLPTSTALSTDFGAAGTSGDTTSLTYTFKAEPGADVDTAFFTFALFSQELPAFAGSVFNDTFKIILNGVNLAQLSDGSAATINNLESSPLGPASSDLVLNTATDAPAHDITAVNAYTKPLSFVGKLNPAGETNTLVIQAADVGDGLLDSGILIKGGTFKAGAGPGGVTIGSPAAPLVVGAPPTIVQVTVDPGPTPPTAPVAIVITPADATLDFGNGAGKPTTITVNAGGPYTVDLPISASVTGIPENGETSVGSVTVTSADPRFNGTLVAPVVVDIASDEAPPTVFHWAAPVRGDFSTASDWTPIGVPTSADHADIDATGAPYIVTVSGPESVATLTTVAGATLAIDDTGPQSVGQLTIGGSIVNAGTIALNAVGDTTALSVGSTTDRVIKLTGGGDITLSDSSKNVIETGSASAATALDNIDNTIAGAGDIDGGNGFALINESGGTIDATGVSHALTITTAAITNQGLLEDTGAGGLHLTSTTISNTGGVIAAAGAGAHVDLDNVSLRGGTLSTSKGGVLNVAGTVTLEDSTSADAITIAGDLTGAGTLALEDGTTTFSAGTVLSTADLSVEAGATADVSGTLGYAGQLANAGTMFVGPGATLDLSGPLSGSGGQFDVYGSGTLDFDDAVGPSQTVAFSGRGGDLVLGSPGTFKAPITGFAAGDTLDLKGETVVGVGYFGSTLTVALSDSTTQTFTLTGGVTAFTTRSDNAGGSIITAAGAARLPYATSITSLTAGSYNAPPPAVVTFAITFSGLAIGFDASHIALSGLAGAAVTGITTTDDTTYQVSVSTGAGSGDLQIKVVGADTGYFPITPVAENGTLGTDEGAYHITTASLTGPGSSDLVAVDPAGADVQVLADKADGTFTNLGSYSTLPAAAGAIFADPTDVTVGDFTGDGRPDLAVANEAIDYPGYFASQSSNGDIAILSGNGDGTFQPATFFSAGVNEYPAQIASGDFNHDGVLDLITANDNGDGAPLDTISLLQGNGDGTFAPPVIDSLAETPEFLAVGDLTGQGHADTVISTDKGIAVVLNGDFLNPTYLDIGASAGQAAIGDLNGDGKADLVVPTQAGLAILLGNGDGTFSTPTFIAPPVGTFQAPVISDVTGDGIPDIVASTGNGFAVLMGNGDGTFNPGVFRGSSNGYDSSYGVAVADVNGDGAPDVILPIYSDLATQPSAPIDTFFNSDGPTGSYYIDRTPATASISAYASAVSPMGPPTVSSAVGAGQHIFITVTVSKPFTLSAPLVLQLNNGVTVQGTASEFGNQISFDYLVKADDHEDTPDLKVTGLAPTSGAITDALGNHVAIAGDTHLEVDADGIPCYCQGTRIRTDRGEVTVEHLAVGDRVVTASGATRPIVWLGHRRLDLTRHPDPQAVWPICVAAGAFGEGLPSRELWMSPGHNVFVEGVLIAIGRLVNGVTIVQRPVERVTYWHVELDAHDIMLAEGLPAESYLDTGNRTAFANGGAFLDLHPDFAPKHWADTCAPLVQAGPELTRAKAALLARAASVGHVTTAEADPHVIADGQRIEPMMLGATRLGFTLPPGCVDVRLMSRSFIPAQTLAASSDARALGLCVQRVQIDGEDVGLDDPSLDSGGWHALERRLGEADQRWTTGVTPMPRKTRLIVIDLAGRGTYWQRAKDNVVAFTEGVRRPAIG